MIIESEIIKWYNVNKRDLPWRNTRNPYQIWVSEIILQQTKVDQALSYYIKFNEEFPDIKTLANASQEKILKVWQGLGYYSRARNMHYTAKYIVNELNSIFPDSFAGLIKLKGIGNYTAAAIASFAYNERVAAVDGNVLRVLSRIFSEKTSINSTKGKKIFDELANELIKYQDPGTFNQAMMEFGALQCVPKNPKCINCPINSACQGFIADQVNNLPVKNKEIKKRNRFFNYLFIEDNQYTYIKERTSKDIWTGLFEFPMIESSKSLDFKSLSSGKDWKILFKNTSIVLKSATEKIIHQLTHQKIEAVFYHVKISSTNNYTFNNNDFLKIHNNDLNNYPVPKIIENYIKNNLIDYQ
jgi:A/G-specific adenine glycosylase